MFSVIIPMAGKSSRFFNYGYDMPKYMLEANGKTLFDYSIQSLPLQLIDKVVFVFLSEHQRDFGVKQFIKEKTDGYEFDIEYVELNQVTQGQAQTCLRAEPFINEEDDLIIYNIDTHFRSVGLTRKLEQSILKYDGIIGAFYHKTNDEKWSFASVKNREMIVKTTAEKNKISDYALTGLYHFTRAIDFFETARNRVEVGKKDKGEFYVAPMYNDLISQGKKFVLDVCVEFQPLGTPKDYEKFIE